MHTAWPGSGNSGLVLDLPRGSDHALAGSHPALEPAQSRRPRQDRADAALLDESLTPTPRRPTQQRRRPYSPTTRVVVLAGLVESIGAYVVGDVDTALLEAEAPSNPRQPPPPTPYPEVPPPWPSRATCWTARRCADGAEEFGTSSAPRPASFNQCRGRQDRSRPARRRASITGARDPPPRLSTTPTGGWESSPAARLLFQRRLGSP